MCCLGIGMAFIGCSDKVEDGVDSNMKQQVTDSLSLCVAVTPTLDCLPIFVASERGIFERESLRVSLVPFTAHMDCDTAIAGGTVHATPTDLVRAERLMGQGTQLHYATATMLGWQLLSSKTARIRKLAQMDDKMLAITRLSATAMLADHLVDSAKLKPERVFRIQVNDVLVRQNMMETGTMDIMLLPEPQATVARCKGCNMLYDSAEDSMAMGVIVFSKKAIEDSLRHKQMDMFIKAYDEACDSINTKGLHYYRDIIATRCKVDYDMVDSLIVQHPVRYSHASPPRQRDIDRVRTWLGILKPSKTSTKKDSKKSNKKKKK